MNYRCAKKGHRWRQKVWGQLGTDVCRRRGCDATRTNPKLEPPDWWPYVSRLDDDDLPLDEHIRNGL